MSHPHGAPSGIRYHRGMLRTPSLLSVIAASAVAAALAVATGGCGKPAPTADQGSKAVAIETVDRVEVPGTRGTPDQAPPTMKMGAPEGGAIAGAPPGGAAGDDPFRLKPEEGTLAIVAPAEGAAGTEVVATVNVTPAGPYHINLEFPTKLELSGPAAVVIAKPKLTAGGHDKAKGDADAFEDGKLTFTVKMTPQPGAHTVTGTFKFAVCDKDTCLAKKEQISIAVAAK